MAIAEVEDNEIRNDACPGVVSLNNDQAYVNAVLSGVVSFVESSRDCELEDWSIEFG